MRATCHPCSLKNTPQSLTSTYIFIILFNSCANENLSAPIPSQLEPVPERFSSVAAYAASFPRLLLEEVRASLQQALSSLPLQLCSPVGVADARPAGCDGVGRPLHNLLLDVAAAEGQRAGQAYAFKPTDVVLLSPCPAECSAAELPLLGQVIRVQGFKVCALRV